MAPKIVRIDGFEKQWQIDSPWWMSDNTVTRTIWQSKDTAALIKNICKQLEEQKLHMETPGKPYYSFHRK